MGKGKWEMKKSEMQNGKIQNCENIQSRPEFPFHYLFFIPGLSFSLLFYLFTDFPFHFEFVDNFSLCFLIFGETVLD